MSASLPQAAARGEVLHMRTSVMHARRGNVKNAFRYGVDYLLLDPSTARGPAFFSRNRFNLFAVHEHDHGGQRGAGEGARWAWDRLAESGLERQSDMVLALLTQPRFLGFSFNPVSFWLLWKGEDLLAVIAEVNNTFGQRHSYLCAHPDFAPIAPGDELRKIKAFHVSPFQDIAGHYAFRFDLDADRTAIMIRQVDGNEGLLATMHGAFRRATVAGIAAAALRRPGGALRVLVLIYWQALKLKLKGVAYRPVPPAPEHEVSR